jgi:hypothetical protein
VNEDVLCKENYIAPYIAPYLPSPAYLAYLAMFFRRTVHSKRCGTLIKIRLCVQGTHENLKRAINKKRGCAHEFLSKYVLFLRQAYHIQI